MQISQSFSHFYSQENIGLGTGIKSVFYASQWDHATLEFTRSQLKETIECLVCVFKQPFSVFQTIFYVFSRIFLPIFSQIFLNNNFTRNKQSYNLQKKKKFTLTASSASSRHSSASSLPSRRTSTNATQNLPAKVRDPFLVSSWVCFCCCNPGAEPEIFV